VIPEIDCTPAPVEEAATEEIATDETSAVEEAATDEMATEESSAVEELLGGEDSDSTDGE
jgi:hypothetical protein